MDGDVTMDAAQLERDFSALFAVEPAVFRAPGRVNLIGEHTDYNDGFVMPCAIGLSTHVAISGRADRRLVIRSQQRSGECEFEIDQLPPHKIGEWCDYVLGVARGLQETGHRLQGANLLVRGGVPIGGGLSSSAAIEVASALALTWLNGISLPLTDLAKLCQRAENAFVGARCGVMDQFVSCLGLAGHALLLDCRSLQFELLPIPEHVRLVICNTMVKHELAGGEYNRRRQECEEGVQRLCRHYPGIRALRDVTIEQLEKCVDDLPPIIYKRCCHVVEENQRVCAAAESLRRGDLAGFGERMRESHRSLRDLYEVSCRELDLMVEAAEGLRGYYGGRMTGGGFGGCTVNMVEASSAEFFAGQISARYQQTTGIEPAIYLCAAADGAQMESLPADQKR